MRFFSELMIFRGAAGSPASCDRGPAWPSRRPNLLDDEELRRFGILDRAVGELSRKRRVLERALSPCELARLAGSLTCVAGGDRLLHDLARFRSILLEKLGKPEVDDLLDEPRDSRVAELRLRLPFELRVPELDGDDGREPLARVFALEVVVLLLQEPFLTRVLVERPGERRTEALQVRPALGRVDVVREREHGLDVRAVPLHRDLDGPLVALALEVHDVLVHRVLRLVDVGDEVPDPALVQELVGSATCALVPKHDPKSTREEGRLAQALEESRRVELGLVEDVWVGKERDRGAGLALSRHPDSRHVGIGLAASELLPVHLPVAPHLGDEPLGERVHHGDADAVQAAGDLVALSSELPARMQLGEHDRECRQPLVGDDVDRDARSGIAHGDGVVRVDGHVDEVVPSGQGLVDRVVDDLVHEMVEPSGTRRADVHPRAQTDRLEALENRDVLCGIGCFGH